MTSIPVAIALKPTHLIVRQRTMILVSALPNGCDIIDVMQASTTMAMKYWANLQITTIKNKRTKNIYIQTVIISTLGEKVTT